MKVGTEDKKKLGILAVVGVLALGAMVYLYSELSTPDIPPPTATTVTTPTAVKPQPARRSSLPSGNTVGISSKAAGVASVNSEAQLDPTLHMEAMLVTESLVYSGNGRNIFSANSAPAVVIPRLLANVRTSMPIAPVAVGPTGPPPPPPIDLKFFGTETSAAGSRRAFLLHGEDVFFVSAGDIVQRRYRVINVEARSIVVEDIANSDRQTLPLQAN